MQWTTVRLTALLTGAALALAACGSDDQPVCSGLLATPCDSLAAGGTSRLCGLVGGRPGRRGVRRRHSRGVAA
jgi:hypothetical protein